MMFLNPLVITLRPWGLFPLNGEVNLSIGMRVRIVYLLIPLTNKKEIF